MCYEFQFYGNSRVICSELQKPAGSQNPSAATGSHDLAGSGVVLVVPQEVHRSLQKAEQPLDRCLALCSSSGCSSLHTWVDAAMCAPFLFLNLALQV